MPEPQKMSFQAEEFFLFLSIFPVVFVPGSENDRINAGASENEFPGGRVLPCSFCARNQD